MTLLGDAQIYAPGKRHQKPRKRRVGHKKMSARYSEALSTTGGEGSIEHTIFLLLGGAGTTRGEAQTFLNIQSYELTQLLDPDSSKTQYFFKINKILPPLQGKDPALWAALGPGLEAGIKKLRKNGSDDPFLGLDPNSPGGILLQLLTTGGKNFVIVAKALGEQPLRLRERIMKQELSLAYATNQRWDERLPLVNPRGAQEHLERLMDVLHAKEAAAKPVEAPKEEGAVQEDWRSNLATFSKSLVKESGLNPSDLALMANDQSLRDKEIWAAMTTGEGELSPKVARQALRELCRHQGLTPHDPEDAKSTKAAKLLTLIPQG